MPRKFDRMPDLPLTVDDPKVEEFMEHYYAISNDKEDHGGFAEMFTEDGEYGIMDTVVKGRDAITQLRKSMWEHIPHRDHVPLQIYTHGHDQMQLMARGTVGYKHHKGHETVTEWAAYYELVDEKGENGGLKFKKVHIIADSASHEGAG